MAVFKRIYPGSAPIRASAAVKVLARCPVSPKQHLLVIQFGKRLVLVGDTGAHLNPLCEISDPEEAASILAQARDESVSAAKRFDSFFGLARKAFSDTPAPTEEEHFDDTHEIPAEIPTEDPSLEATRKEIAGLSDKVRDVAQQSWGRPRPPQLCVTSPGKENPRFSRLRSPFAQKTVDKLARVTTRRERMLS